MLYWGGGAIAPPPCPTPVEPPLDRLVRDLRTALAAAGVDASEYVGHSFPIGAASTAVMYGMPEYLIKTLGQWESAAYNYVIYQDTTNSVVLVARQLVKPSGGADSWK